MDEVLAMELRELRNSVGSIEKRLGHLEKRWSWLLAAAVLGHNAIQALLGVI
jgi:hypothetical protein